MRVKTAARVATVVAASVLVPALTGCGVRDPAYAARAEVPSYAAIEQAPESLADDGTTILVGDPGALTTVRVYEDPRCPVVEEFELTGGASALRTMTVRREVKTEYTLASFRDERMGGDGSKRAVNALRAALDAGRFAELHRVLFQHQAEIEAGGGFTTESLLALADKVEGLRGAEFDRAVATMKYEGFVTASEAAYEAADGPVGPGTPTVVVNGKRIPESSSGVLFDEELFGTLLTSIQRHPLEWKTST
ncbi:DsbA family protein [Streptomyces sp. NBC_00096]|uniref:DsbA family protein n=1 Tax=Streptomyces sp. NBC_00096 TaxID=2975650 RepID=UPI00324FB6D4